MNRSQEIGDLIMPGAEPEIAPGVRGVVFDTGNGIYVPLVSAERPGSGDVAKWLDGLPRDRRVVFPNVISARLAEMLRKRGFVETTEFAPEFGEHVDIMERAPQNGVAS